MKPSVKEYEDFILIENMNGNLDDEAKCFLRYEVMYEENIKSFLQTVKSDDVLLDACPYYFKDYFSDLAVYEKEHGYKYQEGNDGYKTRYAVQIILLLPKGMQGKEQVEKRKRLVKEFIKSLSETSRLSPADAKRRKSIDQELDSTLNYVAIENMKGNGLYVHLIISEREYKARPDYKRYSYSIYWNPHKKKICKKTDPGAEIKYEKGDYILDKEGKRIIDNRRFGYKIRRFSTDNFERMIQQLKENFIVCVKKVLINIKRGIHIVRAGTEERNKKPEYIRQKRAYYSFHFFNRRCIEEVNHCIQFVEYHINYLLETERKKLQQILNAVPDDLPVMDPEVPKIRSRIQQISNLYLKYKKIFEAGWFKLNDRSMAIKTKGIKLPELKSNLDDLLRVFKQECLKLDPNIFII